MLARAFALLLAFGAVVSNAAATPYGLSDAANALDVHQRDSVTAAADNTRNTTVTKGSFCGAHLSDDEFNRAETGFRELLDSGRTLFPVENGTLSARATTIKVYWHIIAANGKGAIDRQLVISNIAALNSWYKGAGIRFELAKIDLYSNAVWFNQASYENMSQWTSMGRATRIGGPKDLNLWSVGMTNSAYAGYARFPYEYKNTPFIDGSIIRYDQLTSGKLVVHEVGHWLGLFHTFQGGCTASGDGVADTPASSSPTSGCPKSRDSCVGSKYLGVDPIHNHMDYSSESCRYQFTKGQYQRMREQCRTYRGLIF